MPRGVCLGMYPGVCVHGGMCPGECVSKGRGCLGCVQGRVVATPAPALTIVDRMPVKTLPP